MTQKSNSRILIDTNKHGIRRETDLDKIKRDKEKKEQRRQAYLKKRSKITTE
jgi:hypothetical protein